MSDELVKAAALLGRKGGLAGRGKKKRRGNSQYYKELAKRRKRKESF